MIKQRTFHYFDSISFVLMLALASIGLLTVFSATYAPDAPFSPFFKKQALGITGGLLLYCICCIIDYRRLEQWGYLAYFLSIGLLMITSVIGSVSMGGQRWINLGFIKFQPSETIKLLFAPFMAYHLETEKESDYRLRTFAPILIALLFTCLLILKQPDLGTALIILFSGISMLWLAGLDRRFFLVGIIACLVLAPIGWKFLKPYQRQRIAVFLGEGDTRKERYQIEQSHIAIGSGGVLGKGFLQGTQNKLHFLPEGRTDFIFSVFCEEFGFVGALLLLLLYILLYARILWLVTHFKNFYAQLLACGLILPLLFSTLINIGMVIGLLPIVGIPLPFMTYGLSHTWISFASLGIVQSIMMRRFSWST